MKHLQRIGLGKVVETKPPGRTPCRDGKFSTLPQAPGVCSYHGGSMLTVRQRAGVAPMPKQAQAPPAVPKEQRRAMYGRPKPLPMAEPAPVPAGVAPMPPQSAAVPPAPFQKGDVVRYKQFYSDVPAGTTGTVVKTWYAKGYWWAKVYFGKNQGGQKLHKSVVENVVEVIQPAGSTPAGVAPMPKQSQAQPLKPVEQMSEKELQNEAQQFEAIIKERENYWKQSNAWSYTKQGVGVLNEDEANRYMAINHELHKQQWISPEEAKKRVIAKREQRRAMQQTTPAGVAPMPKQAQAAESIIFYDNPSAINRGEKNTENSYQLYMVYPHGNNQYTLAFVSKNTFMVPGQGMQTKYSTDVEYYKTSDIRTALSRKLPYNPAALRDGTKPAFVPSKFKVPKSDEQIFVSKITPLGTPLGTPNTAENQILIVRPGVAPMPKAQAAPGIQMIPVQSISVRRDWFQNRATPYSERSVQNIVDAVQAGNFFWVNFDPVSLWAAPDGKIYMLSGHSRLEAFERLCKMGARADGRDFCHIPAKLEANLTLEQAKAVALQSNTLSTKETDLERSEYYRKLRNQGTAESTIKEEAKRLEGQNWTTVLAISHLNPAGKAMNALQALEKADATSRTNAYTIARWIGNARAAVKSLTNRHEDEIFDWLVTGRGYGTKAGQVSNEKEFSQRLTSIINRRTEFGVLAESLNIQSNITLSPVERQYREQVEAAADTVKTLQKQLDEKIKEYRARGAGEAEIVQLTQGIQANLTRARIAYQNLLQKKSDVTQYARQERGLFDELGALRRRQSPTPPRYYSQTCNYYL